MQAYRQYQRIGRDLREHQQQDPESFHYSHQRPRDEGVVLDVLSTLKSHDGEGLVEPRILNRTETDSTTSTVVSEDDEYLGPALDGVEVRERTTKEGKGSLVFVVAWSEKDHANPRTWSWSRRALYTVIVSFISFACMVASSIDSAVAPQAAAAFGVSPVVESLATGIFLMGSGVGSFFAGPFSETFGRLPVYIVSLFIFMVWVMASALSPNIGAQLAFRFLAGMSGAAPLTCAGASISDLWDPVEKTWAMTIYAVPAFGGPMIGPVIGAFMYTNGIPSWRWTDWITLIISALATGITILFLPETHPAIIQSWKAKHLRKIMDEERYLARIEIIKLTLLHRLEKALYRPFVLAVEPIVIAITLYLTVLYCIMFTFLDGYTTIFQETYHISQGLTNTIFVAMYTGSLFLIPMTALVHHLVKQELHKQRQAGVERPTLRPETRLWWAMFGGSWSTPIGLFWLAWTSYASISIWCPIVATGFFGFGFLTIFVSCYLYIIDAYEVNAASALTFCTVVRYIASGGLTVAGVPFYGNVGRHWTVCILAVISTLCAPIPFVLYRYGPQIRRKSSNCLNRD